MQIPSLMLAAMSDTDTTSEDSSGSSEEEVAQAEGGVVPYAFEPLPQAGREAEERRARAHRCVLWFCRQGRQ